MDAQIAIDRITETENLTDRLEDDEANWLIDWGVGKAKGLIEHEANEDAGGEKINDVMAVMRSLNNLVADRKSKSGEALEAEIRSFGDLYTKAFPKSSTLNDKKVKELAGKLGGLSAQEALQQLTASVESSAK